MNGVSDKDTLHRFMYELLPAVYRRRDKERTGGGSDLRGADGGPLSEFLSIVGEQAIRLREDIESLYDNWFIETCQEWVVPYIADLIGYQLVQSQRLTFFSVRREVANTIGYRRRKGSLALLEMLARDIAGWHARAVELYPLIVAAPSIRYADADGEATQRGGLVNFHETQDLDVLESFNGACNEIAHTVDVRRIGSMRTPGRFKTSNVAVFVSRLKIFSVTDALARSQEERGVPHCYTFSALGNDTALFTKPEDETSVAQIAGPLNLPIPIRRRRLSVPNPKRVGQRGNELGEPPWIVSNDYYGREKSFFIKVGGWRGDDKDIEAEHIIPADLSGWRYRPRRGYVALDPQLGRIAFHPQERPRDVWVRYHYAFPAELGGGEYKRSLMPCRPKAVSNQVGDASSKCYSVCTHPPTSQGQERVFRSLQAAFEKWVEERPRKAIIEIQDSAVYDEVHARAIRLHHGQELQFRARSGCRPILRFVDRSTGRPESLLIEGEQNSRLELNGLLIAGRGLEVKKCLGELAIIHSTLVPGWDLEEDRDGKSLPAEESKARVGRASVSLESVGVNVVVSESILGPIQINNGSPHQKTILRIENSILDACGDDEPAICGPSAENYAALYLRNSTILGQVHANVIESADNTIFTQRVHVKRQQNGCIRFCYVAPNSRTPRRYHCQPDLAVAKLEGSEKEREALRVRPIFTSARYGTAAYCQLHYGCAPEITTGAEDQSEMGVFHDLFQAQRSRALQVRLNEYVPGGFESRVLFIN
jgi:hypothetical protein